MRDPLETIKKSRENENFEKSHSAEKCKRSDPLDLFNIHSIPKYQKIEGGANFSKYTQAVFHGKLTRPFQNTFKQAKNGPSRRHI